MPDVVRLIVPAEARHVRLVRLTAAGVAAGAGFDVDDVEDLRVAVNELFALLVDDAESGDDEVEVEYRVDGSSIRVRGRRELAASQPSPPEPDDLALDILGVIVDEHHFEADGGTRTFELLKRAALST
jgi:hypothetical protein